MKISRGYEPRFDIDLEFGKTGETTVADMLGMSGTIEVKTDRHTDSLNLFIETHKWNSGGWAQSGLMTSQANYWVYNVGATSTVIPTGVLRLAVSTLDLKKVIVEYDIPTLGVLLPRVLLQQVKA